MMRSPQEIAQEEFELRSRLYFIAEANMLVGTPETIVTNNATEIEILRRLYRIAAEKRAYIEGTISSTNGDQVD